MKIREFIIKGSQRIRNMDLALLIACLCLVLGTWAFVALASEVKEGETRAADERFIELLRNKEDPQLPVGPAWLRHAMRDVTALGSPVVLTGLTAALLGLLLLQRHYSSALVLITAVAGAGLINFSLKRFYDRPRPELLAHMDHVTSQSFPSGHSLYSTAVYCTIGAIGSRLVRRKRVKIYLLAVSLTLAFLIGISRVYLGVHYPTDVLAGWTVGLVWAIICWLFARRLQRKGAIDQPC